jgi:hypothetical protein
MSSPLLILIVITVVLVVTAVVLANERWQQRIFGTSRAKLAALPLLAGLALWGSAFATDLLKGRLAESALPEDNVNAFVESIQFGFPTVSTAFFDKDYSAAEVRRELAPLRAVKDDVALTAEELGRINDIATQSGMLDEFSGSKTITTRDVAKALLGPISYGYNYAEWGTASEGWEQALANKTSAEQRAEAMTALVHAIRNIRTAAGLFQGIVGMSTRGMVDLTPAPGDCAAAPLSFVGVDKSTGNIYLEFKTFRSLIADDEDHGSRRKAAEQLAHLLQMGCTATLKRAFGESSRHFKNELQLMRKYVAEWNRILESKTSESIAIKVTAANPGRFDSFIYRKAVVGIGPKGSKQKIRLLLDVADDSGAEKDENKQPTIRSDYFSVRSRSAQTLLLQGKLSPDVRQKIYGAYQSEQTLLRVGLLVSAGASEVQVLSQAAPFSTQVAKMTAERLERLDISF